MSKQWRKLGLVYCPAKEKSHPKLISHAANPLPMRLEGDEYRVFFSGRDSKNRSSIGAVDINIVEQKIIQTYNKPCFEHGPEGSFYADGVSIGNCYELNGNVYMLFMGWQAPADGHWRGDIGRLKVNPDFSLQLDPQEAFLSSDEIDPLSLSYPSVLKREQGGYSMWYSSVDTWDVGNGEMLAPIKYAYSDDGHHWHKRGVCVPYEIGKAQAFSRPTVIGDTKQGFEMWFSYRSNDRGKYRIGYATSADGEHWEMRLEQTGIGVSESGWDSQTIEYPYVLEHHGRRYMFYNGNDYGKTGFGMAVFD